MLLNKLKPTFGAKKVSKRVGRGIGCGKGKTCGRGHKGQTARSGYSKKIGFEGGQIPLQRRVPKFGFTSLAINDVAEIRLNELERIGKEVVDMAVLRQEGFIGTNIKAAKVIKSGKLTKPVILRGIKATKGAQLVIEQCGGKVE